MKHKIVYINGDGVGPEIMNATKLVLAATGVEIEWIEAFAGVSALQNGFDTVLPQKTLDLIREHKVAIKGPTKTPDNSSFTSANVGLRVDLDLYANVRPLSNYQGVPTRFSDLNIDMVIFRETTEDVYNGIEEMLLETPGIELTSRITEAGSRRIAEAAFEYAKNLHRNKVTIVHKGNVKKHFYGEAFLDVARQVSKNYPNIECNDFIIDNFCYQMVRQPQIFDVVVTTNLFGDIISDLAAGVVGSLGIAPGANFGDELSVFEAVHGTADDIAGKNMVNPTSLILSSAMMMDELGEKTAANKIRSAVSLVFEEAKYVTGDIQKVNPANTELMAQVIAHRVAGSKIR